MVSPLRPVILVDYSAKLSRHLELKFKVARAGNRYTVHGSFDSQDEFNSFLKAVGLPVEC